MRPLRFGINVTLDGCCDHRAGVASEALHRYWAESLARADALLYGRVTYQMMEAAWRPSASTGAWPDWMEPWMEPFARTIDVAKKYVVSRTLDQVDWNAELGLIDEYEFVVVPRVAGHGPTLLAGLSKYVDLELVSRVEFGSGLVALRYVPRR